tara:strand:+ start:83 stop:370 length:288 start_codon:yes stop_codon:yes gene_type:complete
MGYSFNRDEHLEDKDYQIYLKRKNKLKLKYPNWNDGGSKECKKYIAEVAELFSTDKNFQKFIWESLPKHIKAQREFIINPRKQGQRSDKPTFNYY